MGAKDLPAYANIFYPKWVDTAEKSRLTTADLKNKGLPTGLTHCLTPTTKANDLLDVLCLVMGFGMIFFDIVSAFLHALEDAEVYMYPPKEWFALRGGLPGQLWKMRRA